MKQADAPIPTLTPAANAPDTEWPTLDDLRLRYMHRAIEHTGGNKTRAAVLLGIDRRTLNRILARERRRSGVGTPAK
ncbi:MAG: helix-turn-helix domain-containing protein [Minicystis sp.]